MRSIHFVGGEKGGVGKSVVARVLAQLFIDRSASFSAFDADASHPSLLRHYEEQTETVSLAEPSGLDPIIETALSEDGVVLVDLPAQSAQPLFQWLDEGEIADLAADGGVGLTFWHVSDGGFSSVEELSKLLDRVPDSVEVIVVRNLGRGRQFDQLDGSKALERLKARGGKVVDLPELDGAAMYAIDRHGSSFWAAIHDERSPLALPMMARRRAKIWLERAYAAVEPHAVRRLSLVSAPAETVADA